MAVTLTPAAQLAQKHALTEADMVDGFMTSIRNEFRDTVTGSGDLSLTYIQEKCAAIRRSCNRFEVHARTIHRGAP